MKLQLEMNDKSEIIQYAELGGLNNSVECEINSLPDDFYTNFEPCFYLFKNGDIIKNPDYVEPSDTPPVIGPSKQDKINAQIMLSQAKQKEDQDKFNAQILLKLAGGTK